MGSEAGGREIYRGSLASISRKERAMSLTSIELFAGAGGLALGMSKAGFHHAAVLEWDHDACETIRLNQKRGIPLVTNWSLLESDARKVDYRQYSDIAVISGGPPCQPFSLGGNHKGLVDSRDMFPEAIRSVRELAPKAFIFENVKGLLRESFASYVEYIVLQLTYPELKKRSKDDWGDHLARLERHHTAAKKADQQSGLRYRVVFRLVNAANYGVPQKRERVFFVGFREDLGIEWSFPEPTHSQDTLIRDQWVTGEYWDRHRIPTSERPKLPQRIIDRVRLMKCELFPLAKESAWVTVRDTLRDLPDPQVHPDNDIPNHQYIPGARSYPGHVGSPFDEPAKTLKAGDHGVPGGENMLLYSDGSIRYFSIREAARLQTFPDHYYFSGSWTEVMRQLGNAVPVRLAEVVASSVARTLRRSPHN